MRITHVSVVHKPLDVRIFHKECRTLAAAGHEVHLLVPDPPVAYLDGVHLHPLPGLGGLNYAWRALRPLREVYRRVRAIEADVYHLHDPHLIPLGLLLARRGANVIYDAHEDAPRQAVSIWADRPFLSRSHKLIWSLYERRARKRFAAFISATPAIQRSFPGSTLVRNYPLDEEFDLPCFDGARVPFPEREPLIAYAGGITRVRGIREMVSMLRLLDPALRARLLLMGEIPGELSDLGKEIRGLPGWESVDYLGLLARPEMGEQLARAQAGLVVLYPLPNHVEALPNKMWEYMAAGLPLVASDFPLWRKILGEAGCGLLVDPYDPSAIAEAVGWLLEHPSEAEEMGQRGRRAFEQRYSWRSQGETLVDFYDQLGQRLASRA